MPPRTKVCLFALALSLGGCSQSPTHNTSSAGVGSDGGHDPRAAGEDDGTASAARDSGSKDGASAASRPPTDPAAPRADAGPDSSRPACNDGTRVDVDGDGFTVADGDCDDCQKTINPAAYDVPGNKRDEDCSGTDTLEGECDQQLLLASTAAEDGARALGLCSFPAAASRAWGVTSARYTDASGNGKLSGPMAVGVLPEFGAAKPRAGSALLALSSGVARAPSQPGATPACDSYGEDPSCTFLTCQGGGGKPPEGYPKQNSLCKNHDEPITDEPLIFDQAALELKIRVPSNASAFSFESSFYTSEFPEWICEAFNDFFVVFKDPKPAEYPDGNILFDSNRDPVGVNNGLLAVCDATAQRRQAVKTFTCDQGTDLLLGTGYGRGESKCGAASGGGSTGWLKTSAPVKPGEIITLRFAIWDTADASLDSTALLDHFKWITFEGEPELDIPIETEPVIPI